MTEKGEIQVLGPDDPAPVLVSNRQGRASFLLLADHAGAQVPENLCNLGLSSANLGRHIAIDIGIAEVAEALARRMDAVLIRQRYSRLVIDCNRDPARPDAIPAVSDHTPVPGNAALSPADRAARVAAIHAPYHAAIAAELALRDARGEETVVVALHSFTPVMDGFERPWEAGVLHDGGRTDYAFAVLRELRQRLDSPVGDNQPYAMDEIDYTLPVHCFAQGRRYVELELRQDLLVKPQATQKWSALIEDVLTAAL